MTLPLICKVCSRSLIGFAHSQCYGKGIGPAGKHKPGTGCEILTSRPNSFPSTKKVQYEQRNIAGPIPHIRGNGPIAGRLAARPRASAAHHNVELSQRFRKASGLPRCDRERELYGIALRCVQQWDHLGACHFKMTLADRQREGYNGP